MIGIDYTALVAQFATANGLDPKLVAAVVEQESSGNTKAVRLEQAFYRKYVEPLPYLAPGEKVDRSVSWGLMQVMGQVARELGYQGDLTALCQPDVGLSLGCRHLAACIKAEGGDVYRGLMRWNGGGSPNYANEVLARMKS